MAYTLIELVQVGDDNGRRVLARYNLDDTVVNLMEASRSIKWESVSDYQHLDRCPICSCVVESRTRGDHWRWHAERGDA